MTCESVRDLSSLFLYGELTFEEECRVEDHLGGCAVCRAELDRTREVHALVLAQAAEPSPALLRYCRETLRGRIESEAAAPAKASFWLVWKGRLAAIWNWHVPRPVGALALLAIGFAGARLTMDRTPGPGVSTPVQDPIAARVRYVEPDGNGRVQIVLDETRQRVVSGRLDDAPIRQMLLAAAKDPQDPGLRQESIGILNAHSQVSEVREALLFALQHDSNAGARLRALAGLKAFAHQPEVQKVLSQTVLTDTNPGVRTEAIDLLTQGLSAGPGQQQLVGVLQQLMRKEHNGYVRMRCQKALEELNASLETY